ncbi:hypothetical protein Asd1617_06085 [Shigella dysenteriae 1617]|uniref:Uncharacterized protein n=1 Tax=Shigella dysenteriae 1617 TaxID=754093 RepID=A0A0A7A3X2_SHIDY|nr:hypothetical protein Asd1617_06085 [Shigella dysenteriae 1617]
MRQVKIKIALINPGYREKLGVKKRIISRRKQIIA